MKSACDLLLYRSYQEYWQRGQTYEKQGKVELLRFNENSVEARVQGTTTYTITFSFRAGGLSRKCSCPVKDFCKHMIAVAIAWDKARGLLPPTNEQVENTSIPPALISHADIQKAYSTPIEANLDIIRIAADELGWQSRPHTHLPHHPKSLSNDLQTPVTLQEIKKCFSEIRSWSRRRNFDMYFCAGELVAAFCEVLRSIYQRCSFSQLEELAKVLVLAQAFHYEIIMEIIDDSDGLHEFTEAHLEKLYQMIKRRRQDKSSYITKQLKHFDNNRDNY
jgi:hypothetical protein